jgi:hypothetical protein
MPEDQDPRETQEWRQALDSVVEFDGPDWAAFLLAQLQEEARRHAVAVPFSANTAYINTISVDQQPQHPGDLAVEHKIRSPGPSPWGRPTSGPRWPIVAPIPRAGSQSTTQPSPSLGDWAAHSD